MAWKNKVCVMELFVDSDRIRVANDESSTNKRRIPKTVRNIRTKKNRTTKIPDVARLEIFSFLEIETDAG